MVPWLVFCGLFGLYQGVSLLLSFVRANTTKLISPSDKMWWVGLIVISANLGGGLICLAAAIETYTKGN